MLVNKYEEHLTLKILDLRIQILELQIKGSKPASSFIKSELVSLNNQASLLLKSINKYDFVKRLALGTSLLVGEGNLSFIRG